MTSFSHAIVSLQFFAARQGIQLSSFHLSRLLKSKRRLARWHVGMPGSGYRDSEGAVLCVSPGWGSHSSDDTDCLTVRAARRTHEA